MPIDDEVLEALKSLPGKVDALAAEVRAYRLRWRVGVWLVGAILIFALVAGLNFRYTAQQADCTRTWANGFANRVSVLTPAAAAKNKALDELIRAIVPQKGETREEQQTRFQSSLAAYLQASDSYNTISENNPAPLAPAFSC